MDGIECEVEKKGFILGASHEANCFISEFFSEVLRRLDGLSIAQDRIIIHFACRKRVRSAEKAAVIGIRNPHELNSMRIMRFDGRNSP